MLGKELTLKYRFIQFQEGSQFERWFWGGIGNAGEGSITCEVLFLDPAGAEVAKIQSEGRIGSGFFGGSIHDALGKMGEEVGKYTVQHFGRAGLKPVTRPGSERTLD